MIFRKQTGFTLIELMVVMSITAILSGTGFIAFGEIQQQQLLKKTVKQIRIGLNEAKVKAFYGTKPASCTNGKFEGSRFVTNADGKSYSVSILCSDADNSEVINQTQLDSGVTLTPNTSITFNSLNQGTDLPLSGATLTVTVGSDKTAFITVTPTGEIE